MEGEGGGCLLGHDKNMDEESVRAPWTTKGRVGLSMGEVSVREQGTTRVMCLSDQGTARVRCLSDRGPKRVRCPSDRGTTRVRCLSENKEHGWGVCQTEEQQG